MTRLYSGTATVANGSTTVTVTSGAPLSNANCPADGAVTLAGLSGHVASRTTTTAFELVRPYPGASGSVALTIDPLTPDALSVVNLAVMAARVQAQLNVLDSNSQGLFFRRLGVTGAADPGPGSLAFDAAAAGDITAFYIDPIDRNERVVSGLLRQWTVGTVLVIRSLATTAYVALEMTANVTDHTGWFSGSVRFVESDGVLADGEDVAIGWFRIGNGLAFDESGSFAGRDAFDGEAGGFVYLSDDGDGGAITGGVLFVKASATGGDWGPAIPLRGAKGDRGWAPKFALVTDAARRVLQLVGYVGGEGVAPIANLNEYVGPAGYTPALAVAVDVRGAAGTNGTNAPAATIAIGTVTALASGAAPTVTNAGTPNAAILNFGLPVPEDGVDGVDGTDPGILLIWDEDNVDATQGAGRVWADNDALGSATKIYVSKTNRAGDNIAAFLATLDNSTNPSRKGTIVLTRAGGNAQFTADITALTDAAGYVKLSIANPSGTTGFINNDLISLQFTAAGDQGASGAGSGDVVGPGTSVAHRIATFSGTTGTALEDSGKLVTDFVEKASNGSDFTNKQTTLDNLSLQGADIASNATINLETATGSFVDVTGTTATSAITLNDGHRRRVRAAGAWPITVGASLVLNNAGNNYTCAAGDMIDFVADGTVIRGTVYPVSGVMPGAAPQATTYTKAETDTLVATAAAGAAMRGTVRAASIANINLAAPGAAVDAVTMAAGDLFLPKNQTAPAENGVYVWNGAAIPATRAAQFDTYNEHPGTMIVVQEGTANADTFWYCTSNKGGTLGATAIAFAQLSLTPPDDSVTNAKLANMANATIKGRSTAGAGDPEDLTMPAVATLMAAASGIREKLTANRTYYVRSNGSDSNDGLSNTSGGAFLTITKALSVVASLDCATFNVVVQVADGTYNEGVTLPKPLGSGTFSLTGNISTPANVVINATNTGAVTGTDAGVWFVQGFKLQTTTGGLLISAYRGTSLSFGYINFGSCAGAHQICAEQGALIAAIGPCSVTGQSTYAFMSASFYGQIILYGQTFTFSSGNKTYSIFAYAAAGTINSGSMVFTLSGVTVTAKRYQAELTGIINTSGGGASYFPGGTAGSTATGGQYN